MGLHLIKTKLFKEPKEIIKKSIPNFNLSKLLRSKKV